jgi:hypothetical protein
MNDKINDRIQIAEGPGRKTRDRVGRQGTEGKAREESERESVNGQESESTTTVILLFLD